MSAAALLVTISVVAAVAVPLAISTEVVRERLERDISQWTGQDVAFGTTPELTFWPVPSVTFRNVSIMSRDFPDPEPLASAESVTAEFSVISALTGSPRFTNFQFNQPVFTIRRYGNGDLSWKSDGGRIAEAAEIAAANITAANDNNDETVVKPIPAYELGTLTINDGTIRLIEEVTGKQETVRSLNGTIDWGKLGGSGQFDLTGVFRDQKAHLVLSSDKPLLLLAGENAPISVDLDSAPMTISFTGTANLSSRPFLNGKLVFDTSSVAKALQWIGTDIKPGEAIGTLHVDADMTTQRDRINLDNLIIDIDDNRGIGVLDLQRSKEGIPIVAGTLAFNKLNITSFLKAFTPLPKPGEDIATTIDTRFLRQLGLDLRLSAQSASLGSLMLTDLAAAARIDQGRAIFDVGDATAYGGNVVGKVQISEKGLDGGGEMRLSARGVDFGAVYDALKLKGPLPRGKGNLDMTLKSNYPLWATSVSDLKGTFKLAIQGGTIPSFDIDAFRTLSGKERFFSLSRVATGSLAFASTNFEAAFSDGLAEINKGEIVTDNALITLDGVIPYSKGSLAMAGSLGPKPPAKGQEPPKNPAPTIRFFVGGSWPAPVISPVVSQ